MIESQGPKTYPKIEKWCHGHCDGIIIEVAVLVSDLIEGRPKKVKDWALDMLADIQSSYYKLIRNLAKGKKSC